MSDAVFIAAGGRVMNTMRQASLRVALAIVIALPFATPLGAAGGEPVPPPPKPPADKSAPGVHPVPPVPPVAGIPPVPPVPRKGKKVVGGTPRYILEKDETHEGDLYFMTESVRISGKQAGDLSVFGREIEIEKDGTVTGDINAWVQSADLAGTMGDTVRVFCKDLTVRGHIDGDLIAVCGAVVVEKSAEITGDVDLKGADL